MISRVILLFTVVTLASCSAPKYAYYFDNHYYTSVNKKSVASNPVSSTVIHPQELTASISDEPITLKASGEGHVTMTYLHMNKAERKTLRYHLKREIKGFISYRKSDSTHEVSSTGWDSDLKLATVFGAVGVTGMIIGGSVFNIVGWISFLIGLVFFVKWVIRQ